MRWKTAWPGQLALAVVLAALVVPGAARADDVEERIPMRPGGRLTVDLSGGTIEVDSHEEDAVEIDGRAEGSYEFDVRYDDDEVTVRGERRGFFPIFGARVRLHVRVPREFDLELKTSGGRIDVQEIVGEIDARTSGGRIDLDRIRGDVEVATSGGRIRAREIEGELEAETSGGPIHLSEILGRVDVKTSGGSIRVREVSGDVQAETSGGGIDVRFAGEPAGHLKTSGGSIEVEVPRDAGFGLDARTSGGRVEIDDGLHFSGELRKSEAHGDVGGGGGDLDLETSGGNIRIRAR